MRYFFILSGLLLHLLSAAQADKTILRSGDLIFIVNPTGQGKAIQLATHSKFTHVGIVFIENGKTYVYHAVEPVIKSTLKEFVSMSADKTYEIKRLKQQDLLTQDVLDKMLKSARKGLGKHYDLAFNWDDERLYCSEYVWKIYKQNTDLDIGNLKPLKSFDLSHPAVQAKLKERYGDSIPLDEKMISPGDMYESDLIE